MFNIGAGEMALIAVVALLVLGPKRLPELARGLGKFMREFRRQTDEVRSVVEREFYRMDQDLSLNEPPPTLLPAPGSVSQGPTNAPEQHDPDPALPAVTEAVHSQSLMPAHTAEALSGTAEPTALAAPPAAPPESAAPGGQERANPDKPA